MTNILTAAEAAYFVRTDAADAVMLMLLPMVDDYIKDATGRDWAADTVIHPKAKLAAGMTMAAYYDNPSQLGSQITDSPLASGLSNLLMQLEVEALKYRKSVFHGRVGAGAITLTGALIGDAVIKLVGVYGSTGSQAVKFESTITVEGQIQQTHGGDLSENIYAVVLKNPAEDVTA